VSAPCIIVGLESIPALEYAQHEDLYNARAALYTMVTKYKTVITP
jgi:hypothetical protein